MPNKIKLGVRAKDIVTGFTGIVYAKAKYLTGCNQFALKPGVDEKGNIQDAHWFDEGALEYVDKGISKEEVKADKPGGPSNPDAPKV